MNKRRSKHKARTLITVFTTLITLNLQSLAIAMESKKYNDKVFELHKINHCGLNEYYDFNLFKCIPCDSFVEVSSGTIQRRVSQPTANKLGCKCSSDKVSTVHIFSDYSTDDQPHCEDFCSDHDVGDKKQWQYEPSCLPTNLTDLFNGSGCKFKYINVTAYFYNTNDTVKDRRVRITHFNLHDHSDCSNCDLRYNFQYQGNCIANHLMKPYLRYDVAFWPTIYNVAGDGSTVIGTYFKQLKFVAFFCMQLRNATACQHLANMCVLSHYDFNRNSPCSAFRLSQASDQIYTNNDMNDRPSDLRPFLFYRRGKSIAQLLMEPLPDAQSYSLEQPHNSWVRFLSTTHTLDGRLHRWGALKLPTLLDLCHIPSHKYPWFKDNENNDGSISGVPYANRDRHQTVTLSDCELTLEQLIDMAQTQANKNFISIFLHYNSSTDTKPLLRAVPLLIEDLVPANQENVISEWQLVKRFQMIEAHIYHSHQQSRHQRDYLLQQPAYTDANKLHIYRQLHYVTFAELQYRIHVQEQRISLPLLRLRYRKIIMHANSTLNERLPFQLRVSYKLIEANHDAITAQAPIVSATVLPVLLLSAMLAAAMHAYGCHRRRHNAITTTSFTQQRHNVMGTHRTLECNKFTFLVEFLLYGVSHTADALLASYLTFAFGNAIRYYTTHSLLVSLPLARIQSDALLGVLIYVALALKCFFLAVHGWRISHCDIFFVDWERPRNYDTTHFNLKNSNLETSSMCSSVRTYVTEFNVSAWRMFYTANEWIRLSSRQRTSTALQCLLQLLVSQFFNTPEVTHDDPILRIAIIVLCYSAIYILQLLIGSLVLPAFYGYPLKSFLDLCSLANVSVFTLLESTARGFYIHGRSPYGFADTDMSSMLVQLQRESQNMCGRRGLLSDSDHQMYVILPPMNLRMYFERLLVPFQRSFSISQAHYHKAETSSSNGSSNSHTSVDHAATTVAYCSVNRFFCAFIDHAIREIDYIIKEKSFVDRLFNCEFDKYLSESRGTFFIDETYSFTSLFLHGNQRHIFTFELMLIICLYISGVSLSVIFLLVYILNKSIQMIFRHFVRENIAVKTLIDKRFLVL